jgi:signal transduction histidine kinase
MREGKALQIEGRFPNEVQPLVDNFNAVLSLNSGLVERARTQAENLEHAVKTPLTVLVNAAQSEPSTLGSLVLEQVWIVRRQIDHHLAWARAAAAVQANGLRVPLREPLESLIRVMRKVHAQRDLIIVLHEVPESAVFRGDLQDLHEMVGNLLDNACKWARHRVELCVAVESTSMMLSIQDDGPGLDPKKRELIFQHGVRMDERTPGFGLGMAIVRDLAQLYGGDFYAQGAEMGGLNVILRLPLV